MPLYIMKTALTLLLVGLANPLYSQSLSSAINAKDLAFENSIGYFAAQDFANGETLLEQSNVSSNLAHPVGIWNPDSI